MEEYDVAATGEGFRPEIKAPAATIESIFQSPSSPKTAEEAKNTVKLRILQ